MSFLGIFGKAAGKGAQDKVRKKAMRNCPYTEKLEEVKTHMELFRRGRPESFRAFISGYMDFKRGDKQYKLDDGYANLVILPVMSLIESAPEPTAALKEATGHLSPDYRQFIMDNALTLAANCNSRATAEALLAAGADPNAHGGQPLFAAVRQGHQSMIELLAAQKTLDWDLRLPEETRENTEKRQAARAKFAPAAPKPAAPAEEPAPVPKAQAGPFKL